MPRQQTTSGARTTSLASGTSRRDYFQAIGMPLKRGRGIDETDGQGRQFVSRGERVIRDAVLAESGSDRTTFQLCVRRSRGRRRHRRRSFRGLERVSEPQVYLSYRQVKDGAITFYAPKALAVRTIGDPAALAPRFTASSIAPIRGCPSPKCKR